MSKCIGDGGTCGLGGYCDKCPHVDNTPDREALIDRFMTDIPLPEGVYHNLRSFADEFITEVEKHYKARVIDAVDNRIKYHKNAAKDYLGFDFQAYSYHMDRVDGLNDARHTIERVE